MIAQIQDELIDRPGILRILRDPDGLSDDRMFGVNEERWKEKVGLAAD